MLEDWIGGYPEQGQRTSIQKQVNPNHDLFRIAPSEIQVYIARETLLESPPEPAFGGDVAVGEGPPSRPPTKFETPRGWGVWRTPNRRTFVPFQIARDAVPLTKISPQIIELNQINEASDHCKIRNLALKTSHSSGLGQEPTWNRLGVMGGGVGRDPRISAARRKSMMCPMLLDALDEFWSSCIFGSSSDINKSTVSSGNLAEMERQESGMARAFDKSNLPLLP